MSHILSFAGDDIDLRLRAEAGLERDLAERPSPEARAAAGVRYLLKGVTGQAIAALEAARLESPNDPRILNDLAAAYLASGLREGGALHLLKGLELARRAFDAAPDYPEPLFNLALALDSFHAREAASDHWRRYLRLHGNRSYWSEVALGRVELLSKSTKAARWLEVRRDLRRLAEEDRTANLAGILAEFPEQALEEAETWLLSAWPEAVTAGDAEEAKKILKATQAVADGLETVTVEFLVAKGVREVTRARSPEARVLIARAYQDLGQAIRGVEAFDMSAARRSLDRSLPTLVELGSVYVPRARLLLALCSYQDSSYEESHRLALLARVGAERVGDLETSIRSSQILGVIEAIRFRYQEALRHLDSALKVADSLAWQPAIASSHGLLGETFGLLGMEEEAWRHRLEASARLGSVSKARVVARVLGEMVDAARERDARVAVLFSEDLMAATRESRIPVAMVVGLQIQASSLAEAGDSEAALAGLGEAESWLGQVEGSLLQDTLRGDLLLARADILAEDRPTSALGILEDARELYDRTRFEQGVPWVLRGEAKSLAALGDVSTAVAKLEEAIDKFEVAGSSISEPLHRMYFTSKAQELYEEMVRLLVDSGDSERALLFSERGRWALKSRGQLPRGSRAATESLPLDTAVISYRALPESLLLWVARGDRRLFQEVPVDRRHLAGLIQDLDRSIRWRSDSERRSEELFELLVAPAAPLLVGAKRIHVVPDGPIQRVSFGTLSNPQTGQYLALDFMITVSASVSDAIDLATQSPQIFSRDSRILAMAGPETPRSWNLPTLPATAREVARVATVFPGTRAVRGNQASERSFHQFARESEIVHVASHAFGSGRNPLLSAIALSPGGGEDGLLFAHEVLDRQPGATRLVVLSSCSSASAARGNVHLALAFLASGVPQVVATLWEVHDASAATLASTFYSYLSDGRTAGAALKAAQVDMINNPDPDLAAPASWGAYQLFAASSSSAARIDGRQR